MAPTDLRTAQHHRPDEGYGHDHGHAGHQRWPCDLVVCLSFLPAGVSGHVHRRCFRFRLLCSSYSVTATNTGGSDTATLAFSERCPFVVTYSQSSFTLTKGTAMTAASPTSSGGTVTAGRCLLLPAGLSLDTTTGEISGTPTR